MQGSNFIIPLLIFPYLVRVLGTEKFGIVSFAQAFAYFFIVVTDYGFNVSAVKEIAVCKDDPTKLNRLCNEFLSTKLLLLVISFCLNTLVCIAIPKFYQNIEVILFSFTLVLGQTLLPFWFFQGIEKMKFMAYFNLISKVISTFLIFVLITRADLYVYVNVLQGTGNVVSSIVAFVVMYKKFGIRFQLAGYNIIFARLKTDWLNFVSSFSINFYINANIVILGFYASDYTVGIYSIAEKVLTAMKQMVTIIFYAIYPKVCIFATQSLDILLTFLRKILLFIFFIFLIAGIGVYFLSHWIIVFVSGSAIAPSIELLKAFSFVPLVISLNIPAYQLLLAFNQKKYYTWVLLTGSMINLILNLTLTPIYEQHGTFVSILVTELYISTGLYAAVFLSKILILKKNGLHSLL